ncbi:MAG: hypothetical protein O3A00_20500 [Planctomycetota bacterium]|nr:hypothetical protein [Planctomycetota bacterium]
MTVVVTSGLALVCAFSVSSGQVGGDFRDAARGPGHSTRTDAGRATQYDFQLAQAKAKEPEPAKPPEPVATTKLVSPRDVLTAARQRLREYKGLKAGIVESINIGSKPFKATGTYLQGPGDKVSVEFKFAKGEALSGSMKQVCDGQILWTRFDVGRDSQITRQDIEKIRAAFKGQPRVPDYRLSADIGFGGLKGLLSSLQDTMDFSPARTETHPVMKQGQSTKAEMIVLRGKWNSAMREVLLGDNAKQKDALFPPYVPELAWVYLDAENLFPYRIMYLKKEFPVNKARALVTLEFTPDWSVVPAAEEFEYSPPDEIQQQDITNQVIEGLKKRLEASKKK